MDKITKDAINTIAWFIPNRKLRDSVRHLLNFHYKKQKDIEQLLAYSITNTKEDFIIIEISGGLSDQIGFYTYARYIELKYNKKIKYDLDWYSEHKDGISGKRNFELLQLFPNIKLNTAKEYERIAYKNAYEFEDKNFEELLEALNENILNKIYLTGYRVIPYQYVAEISDTIRKELDFDKAIYPLLKGQNLDYYNEIKASEVSIGIHVRRGDYIKHAESINVNIPNEQYFIDAVKLIASKIETQKIKLFFFSDEMEWITSKIIPKIKSLYEYTIIEGNADKAGYIDFYLLMNTMHQIRSVGNFAVKAHFFCKNPNKIFVTPSSNEKISNPKISDTLLFQD